MASLKTFLHKLGAHTARSPDQLNQWQRALVAADVLVLRPGRGPGSGVELNGQSVATLLLALLSSEIRSSTVDRVKSLIKYKPDGSKNRCAVTGASNLRDSIAIGLEQECYLGSRRATLWSLKVIRADNTAIMSWEHSKGFKIQKFSLPGASSDPIEVEIALKGDALQHIVSDLRASMGDPENEDAEA